MMKTVLKIFFTFSFLALFTMGSSALARFHHDDANFIDSDSNLGTEYYNDIASYRIPYPWRKLWDQSSSGFRVSAGSLTMTRFYYVEDIRIDPIATAPVSIAYEQHRAEDFTEILESREVRLGISLIPEVRLLVLGDGGALKEYGDVGAGLRLFESPHHATDVLFWSVDHYYNEKNHEQGARRADLSRTWVLRSFGQDPAAPVHWQILVERDLPIYWSRPTVTKRDYEYERSKADLRVATNRNPAREYFVEGHLDHKNEALGDLVLSDRLKLDRKAQTIEVGMEGDTDEAAYSLSAEYVSRTSKWTTSGTYTGESPFSKDPFPTFSEREEVGVYGYWHKRLASKSLFTSGLIANRPQIKEETRSWDEFELKAVTAFHWHLGQASGFALNATWDIDQLTRDFPYKKATFRPWGGGNIQAFAAF